LIDGPSAGGFPAHAIDQIRSFSGSDSFARARLRALFFGGGTASLMPEEGLGSILMALLKLATACDIPEVTVECEPGTINVRKLHVFRGYGVNRISVGAQTLNNDLLRRIGRKHTTEDSLRLIDACHEAGIHNVHIDLMYGLPDQSQADWERTVAEVVRLPVTHISTYKLFVFLYGALHRISASPRAENETAVQSEALRAMCDASTNILETAGFRQYSLTEFARPDWESEYIRSCFDGSDILPIGPGAFGRCGDELWENTPYVQKYGDVSGNDNARAFRMSQLEVFKRDVVLGLWLLNVDLERCARRCRITVGHQLRDLLNELSAENLLTFDGERIIVEPQHRFSIGAAMQRLAQLETEHWGQTASAKNASVSSQIADCPTRVEIKPQVNSILRTARRDARLFAQLRTEPMGTLRALGVDLTSPEIDMLISAIQGTSNDISNDSSNQLRQTWLAIEAEHSRLAPSKAFRTRR
jgi:oxygen-independent coproporphyrinogen III oxidase